MTPPAPASVVIPGPVVPYVRIGRERWTDRATRYLGCRDAIRIQARAGLAGRLDPDRATGPWALDVEFRRHASRGDLDNLVKTVMDALEGVAWSNDYAVVAITARRLACARGEDETAITVTPLGGGIS